MTADSRFLNDRFPRSSRYHPDWIVAAASGGANALWLTEWLAEAVALRPGLRVLDLACGRAASSIFLAREFGVEVWAADLWFSAAENRQRVEDAGVADRVHPVHADARALPFAPGFFDAIVCIDAFVYFGTDDLYLNALARFLKPQGTLAIAGVGLIAEIDGDVPAHLRAWWTPDHWCLHSAAWWRRHWQRTGIVDVERADTLPDGWRAWLDWQVTAFADNVDEITALNADAGHHLGYIRVVARRTGLEIAEPIVSMPTHYIKAPLLREDA
ncbi:MAG TPA: class I SAM-dependent methyltransferase [Rhodanobacteraceae bacterium]|nr:class I SAM-dependent methyltransferase [Rhodanobacteraceae bacterium]